MRLSPRERRLAADYAGVQQLAAESTILSFQAHGRLPETYRFFYRGAGTYRTRRNTVALRDEHEIVVELGAAYPRLMPNIHWQTPVFHPNISSGGVVCLGGYGTNWVPSLRLDELCNMLWDMIRYRNYDTESPYNREAALWAREQSDFHLPLDSRPLRNRVAGKDGPVVMAQAVVAGRQVAPPPVALPRQHRPNGSPAAVPAASQSEIDYDDVLVEVIREPADDGIQFLN